MTALIAAPKTYRCPPLLTVVRTAIPEERHPKSACPADRGADRSAGIFDLLQAGAMDLGVDCRAAEKIFRCPLLSTVVPLAVPEWTSCIPPDKTFTKMPALTLLIR